MTQAATKPRRQRSDAAIPDVAQAGMDDMIIVNAGLEADIETYLLHREAAKLANAAHARIKSVIKANDYVFVAAGVALKSLIREEITTPGTYTRKARLSSTGTVDVLVDVATLQATLKAQEVVLPLA